ncbi:PhzF family phenazine biosynthesis protein [Frateuria terrea]|uniref:Phenazine biosynthesis protein PhzF family n=1 Tax=Frateuria terrea TaxID=529704 RepID=A0A1H6YMR7_9GAMM|nr:PhzF family phenazine biosynthesis protein [Frateuria terrea]SEJ41124.1 phenazine biosynthesis protein PhzF family [Frateuria terrea]SFP74532.1 phenazine biosynthesis protein PhzF family [Frateuria terrea]
MPTFDFLQLDVFASRLFEGNPLAVVLGADALDGPTMQRIARWTNLSETAFLLRPTQPGADYRVRIFTPRQELPFAGHPSVGSAYAAIEAGCVPAQTQLVQECAAGLLPVRVQGDGAARSIHVQAPPARIAHADDALSATLASALQTELDTGAVHCIDNGPLWIVCNLDQATAVRALVPDLSAIASLCQARGAVGVSVFGSQREGDAAMAVRAFCPADGIPEDPVTGSANAAIGALLRETGALARYGSRYVASQGREVSRDGRVEVSVDEASGAVSIGGRCAVGVRGKFTLD